MLLLVIPVLLLLACASAVAYHSGGWLAVFITAMAYALGYVHSMLVLLLKG